jgi:hypothetical protein
LVSAVYHEGISTTSLAGLTSSYSFDGDHSVGHATMQGTSQTGLSSRLSPPDKPYENPFGRGTKVFFGVCLYFFFLAGLPLILMGFVWWQKQKEAAARHAYDDPLWLVVMERWSRAYYCSKDDAVFLPGQAQLIPAGQARETIFALPAPEFTSTLAVDGEDPVLPGSSRLLAGYRYKGRWRVLATDLDGLARGDEVALMIDEQELRIVKSGFVHQVSVVEVAGSGGATGFRLALPEGHSILLDWWAGNDVSSLQSALRGR